MNVRFKKFMLVCLVAIALVPLFVCSCTGSKITFTAKFYFVCYKSQDDAHSASSVSSAVQSLGGAGYVIDSDGRYYIAFACYYDEDKAQSVCSSLKESGLECTVLAVETQSYDIADEEHSELYSGCLETLCQIADIMYNLANSLDEGSLSQLGARDIILSCMLPLRALCRQPLTETLKENITYILDEMAEAAEGFVYARDVRALQIALCDCVINAQFY